MKRIKRAVDRRLRCRRIDAGHFVDRVDLVEGVGLPLLVAMVVSVLITAMAATRHVRGALALQPIEALS